MSEEHHADTGARLRRMADQIANNLRARGHEEAVEETAEHIWKFWDPRMKAKIFADDLSQLTPIAREAIERIRRNAQDKDQALEEFNSVGETGHCDAG
ncbi:MAG TPA: formate dehydrogenase subunit delta [Croceibacterium sp.]|nr:formate dehydrogenase subunit delta [Croceibacterium sp.]